MAKRNFSYYACDFETTVYKGQDSTNVWSFAFCKLYEEDVFIFGSIEEGFNYFFSLGENLILYFHNLKFDGSFILNYFLGKLKLKLGIVKTGKGETQVRMKKENELMNDEFTTAISSKGQWYMITLKKNNKIIQIRDSLKLLPFSLKEIGDAFKTKHRKLEMKYEGFRYPNCFISDEEKKYIENDVLVLKEALEIMFTDGNNKLTIGSCCMSEYKKSMKYYEFRNLFPNLEKIEINEKRYGVTNLDSYIRRSYKGGWCYFVKEKSNKVLTNGVTVDINSLYPYVMHSDSGNKYPVGFPHLWHGNYIPEICYRDNIYFFIRIKTRFYLRKNKLPCIQIKNNLIYKPTEWLETSDFYDKKTGNFYTTYKTLDGVTHDTRQVLTLTMTDYELIKEQYELVDFEILDGCYFFTSDEPLFDEYIDKYKKIKQSSTGAMRTEAKLFSNNLYGKFASSSDSSFKVPYIDEDNILHFYDVDENEKEIGYIPIGSAITSYARNYTIRKAQANFYGSDKKGFCYADTDSLHCDFGLDELVDIPIDSKKYGYFKCESEWDKAIFVRQKTYIEHVIKENQEVIEKPYFDIKCAGMPERCKRLINFRLEYEEKLKKENEEKTKQEIKEIKEEYGKDAIEFLLDSNEKIKPLELEDFKIGLEVPCKLRPVQISGGVLLVDTTYKMR